ncbi:MAG: hypothetical protein KGZ30_02750 [Anaplasmataceae bacterium]|nr:hypothetical protein [Anaplasmataceae bacterium]
MDNLREQLSQLKNIQPDQGFSTRSRLAILSTSQETPTPLTWKQVAMGIFEYGGALALAAVLFVVIAGNTPIGKMLAPFDAGSLNSAHLQAEAEAIDIQIKLLDFDSYEEISASAARSSTPATSSTKNISKKSQTSGSTNETSSLIVSEEETSTTILPDDALLLLSR